MNTIITVTPENLDTLTDFPQVAAHLKAIATPGGSAFQSLDTAESYLRGAFPGAFVYRGGSHVALHLGPTQERVLLVTERRPEPLPEPDSRCPHCGDVVGNPAAHAACQYVVEESATGTVVVPRTAPVAAPQAPQATTAPTIRPNDPVDVFVNQASREGYVLAVLGDEYLLEYTMPKGTTALQIRKVNGGYFTPAKYWQREYLSVSYTSLSRKWLQAIVDAGTTWEGKAQGVYVAASRWGKSNNRTVPSAADLLAAKKAVR